MLQVPTWLFIFVLASFQTLCRSTIEVRNMISGRIYNISESELPSNSCTIRIIKHIISKREQYELTISQQSLFHNEKMLWNDERINQLIGCDTKVLRLDLLYQWVTVVVWTGYTKYDVFKLKVHLFLGESWPNDIADDIAKFKRRLVGEIKSLIRQKIGVLPEQQNLKLQEMGTNLNIQHTMHVQLMYSHNW